MTASAVENTVRGLHIGGQWTDAEGGKTFEDTDFYTPTISRLVALAVIDVLSDRRCPE